MNGPPLPDDLSRWPEGPYELLGVAPGTSQAEVRRAYTRLIRVYKPEQFPEHFRRIREAYEAVLRFTELFGFLQRGPDPVPPDREMAPPQPHGRAVAPAPLREEGPEELWGLVLAGEQPRAYQELVRWSERHPGRVEGLLQLYWLLRVNPALDGGRSPNDWLVHGLLANGLTGPLRELYRRELADNPAEAASDRCARLLDGPASLARLVELVEWRWQALVRRGAWGLLEGDVKTLRPRIYREDAAAWVRLLLTLADALAWSEASDAKRLMETCREEIGQHEHLTLDLPYHFDRFDFLLELSGDWLALEEEGNLPHDLLELIALSWAHPFTEVRPRLQRVLGQISEAPQKWLRYFDGVNARSKTILAQFRRLLDQLQQCLEWQPADLADRVEIAGLVIGFFGSVSMLSYAQVRSQFLDFCLREAVAPEMVAGLVLEHSQIRQPGLRSFCTDIATDWPLRYICRADALFWA